MDTIIFLGFGLHAWITIITVLTMFTILLFTKWRTDFVFLAGSVVLGLAIQKTGIAERLATGILAANIFIVNIVYPLTPPPSF